MRRIMAGGVVAGQNAHMESLLAEEEQARQEASRVVAAAAAAEASTQSARTGVSAAAAAPAASIGHQVRVVVIGRGREGGVIQQVLY